MSLYKCTLAYICDNCRQSTEPVSTDKRDALARSWILKWFQTKGDGRLCITAQYDEDYQFIEKLQLLHCAECLLCATKLYPDDSLVKRCEWFVSAAALADGVLQFVPVHYYARAENASVKQEKEPRQ